MACWSQWKVPLSKKNRRPLEPVQHYTMAPIIIKPLNLRIAANEMAKRKIN